MSASRELRSMHGVELRRFADLRAGRFHALPVVRELLPSLVLVDDDDDDDDEAEERPRVFFDSHTGWLGCVEGEARR